MECYTCEIWKKMHQNDTLQVEEKMYHFMYNRVTRYRE